MDTMVHAADSGHGDDGGHAIPHGWRRFVYSTNHKDIGTMYLVFAIIAGTIGAVMSIAIRAELMEPPMIPATSANTRYIVPMSLWFVE